MLAGSGAARGSDCDWLIAEHRRGKRWGWGGPAGRGDGDEVVTGLWSVQLLGSALLLACSGAPRRGDGGEVLTEDRPVQLQ